MKLKYYAHSCFGMEFACGQTFVTDPYDESVTYPPCDAECTVALVSHDHFDHNHTQSLRGDFTTVKEAGSYTFGGVTVQAMHSFHDDKQGALRGDNLLMRIEGEGLRIAHLGDLGHMPTPEQYDFLKDLDLLLIPIGGTFTVTTKQAEAIIAKLEPCHVLAMHYRTPEYDIPITTADEFIADTGAVILPREIEFTAETLDKLPKNFLMAYK